MRWTNAINSASPLKMRSSTDSQSGQALPALPSHLGDPVVPIVSAPPCRFANRWSPGRVDEPRITIPFVDGRGVTVVGAGKPLDRADSSWRWPLMWRDASIPCRQGLRWRHRGQLPALVPQRVAFHHSPSAGHSRSATGPRPRRSEDRCRGAPLKPSANVSSEYRAGRSASGIPDGRLRQIRSSRSLMRIIHRGSPCGFARGPRAMQCSQR